MSWFKNLTVKEKFACLVVVVLACQLLSGFFAIYYFAKISQDTDEIHRQMSKAIVISDLAFRGQQVTTIMLDLTTTADSSKAQADIRRLGQLVQENGEIIGNFSKQPLNPAEKEQFDSLIDAVQRTAPAISKTMQLATEGKRQEAYSEFTRNVAENFDIINANLSRLAAYASQEADNKLTESVHSRYVSYLLLAVVLVIAVILSGGIAWYIARTIITPLRLLVDRTQEVAAGNLAVSSLALGSDEIGRLSGEFDVMVESLRTLVKHINQASEHMAASSEEMTAGAGQSAQAAQQVAGAICDVAAAAVTQVQAAHSAGDAVENMAGSIRQIAGNTGDVATMAEQTANVAAEGCQAAQTAIRQMANAKSVVNNSVQAVSELGERSREIGQIVDVIANIAGQTNLLALNAAIEAARAGEQGRGFAVVAEEVRNLAEQSQKAAKQIALLIGQIQGDTAKAVASMDSGNREVNLGTEAVNAAGDLFGKIQTLINQVSKQIQGISTAIQQLAVNSQQIVAAVKEIDRSSKDTSDRAETVSAATEQQAAAMGEIADSSQLLAKMAEELRGSIQQFKV